MQACVHSLVKLREHKGIRESLTSQILDLGAELSEWWCCWPAFWIEHLIQPQFLHPGGNIDSLQFAGLDSKLLSQFSSREPANTLADSGCKGTRKLAYMLGTLLLFAGTMP